MKATSDGRAAIRSGLRGSPAARILAAMAFGALLGASLGIGPADAQTATPAPEAGSGTTPLAGAAPVATPDALLEADAAAPAATSGAQPVDAAIPSPRVTEAVLPSTLPRDLSPWGMFLSAVVPVKIVMVGLALASLATWRVWLAKTIELLMARAQARRNFEILAHTTSLRAAEKELGPETSPISRFAAAATGEAGRSEGLAIEGVKDRTATLLSRIEAHAGRRIMRGTGILATVGATAPFIGLFGTVWGIMDSFIGISKTNTTNLAVVAPGIAEALLATAMGLIAAIPAVVMYNGFARAITSYRAQLGDAAAEVLRHLSRDLDREAFPPKEAAPIVRLHQPAE